MNTHPFERSIARLLVSTLAIVVCTYLAGEAVLRSRLDTLSDNARRVASGPGLAQALARGSDDGLETVLILGNSVSNDGIDAEIVGQYLPGTVIAHQPVDSSVLRDWYYILHNFYTSQGVAPDAVVLPVGFDNPLLRTNARTEDLLFTVLGWGDLPDLAERSEVDDPEELLSLYANKGSALIAFRGRLQQRILSAVVPDFADLRRTVRDRNIEVRNADAAVEEAAPRGEPVWLDEFTDLTDRLGIEVVVVAVPTEDLEGGLAAEDLERIRERGWSYVAPPEGQSWSAEEIPDGHHMTREGEIRYSNLLGPMLAQVLSD